MFRFTNQLAPDDVDPKHEDYLALLAEKQRILKKMEVGPWLYFIIIIIVEI